MKLISESLNEFQNMRAGGFRVEELQNRLDDLYHQYSSVYDTIDPEMLNTVAGELIEEWPEDFMEGFPFHELTVWDESHGEPREINLQEIIDYAMEEPMPEMIPQMLKEISSFIDLQEEVLNKVL